MDKLMVSLLSFWNDITGTDREKGATMVEYGIMVALIAIVVLAAVTPLGAAIAALFNRVTAAI
ncbi:hypothetical protein GCM10027449_23830 [Sinomonas notoginsengisoli]|uniref:Flp family type IVb pilin n=1 Tax=Sinomonas notoginsengisoli TaxID=1457311 RepID=UPI001F2118D9|nr:Flp family type IVb pilin [Sinomonas notoginsengisoli]